MKKIIVLLGAIFVFTSSFATINVIDSENRAVEASQANEYEFVQNVRCISFGRGYDTLNTFPLYRGINTCEGYYVKYSDRYCPVHESNQEGYKYMFYDQGQHGAWHFNY